MQGGKGGAGTGEEREEAGYEEDLTQDPPPPKPPPPHQPTSTGRTLAVLSKVLGLPGLARGGGSEDLNLNVPPPSS